MRTVAIATVAMVLCGFGGAADVTYRLMSSQCWVGQTQAYLRGTWQEPNSGCIRDEYTWLPNNPYHPSVCTSPSSINSDYFCKQGICCCWTTTILNDPRYATLGTSCDAVSFSTPPAYSIRNCE